MTDASRFRPPRRKTAPPPARQSGPYLLTVFGRKGSSKALKVEAGRTYALGRDAGSDLVLDHPWVSERHAEVLGGDPPRIVDLGSRNGTLVNGDLVEPHVPKAIPAGAVVGIGTTSIFVTRADEVASGVVRRAPVIDEPQVGTAAANSLQARSPLAPGMVLRDKRMLDLYALVERVAASRIGVLITGETGAGKELLAQAIHRGSARGEHPLYVLNCAAIPDALIESELFGYERGAFSGAVTAKPGMFEAADGSSLFLDEIGELPLAAQAKLLRVLETGEVQRLGALRPLRVDTRIIAATNRDLFARVASGSFRADLLYRLNGIALQLPPLRERPDDIGELACHFATRAGLEASPLFSPEALEALRAHTWPGNVRELKSLVERAVLLLRNRTIEKEDLLPDMRQGLAPTVQPHDPVSSTPPTEQETFASDELPTSVLRAALERKDRRRIEEALGSTGGNQKDAARLLGISRRTLIKRLDQYALVRPRKRKDGDDT